MTTEVRPKYFARVGDLFAETWGYDETRVDFWTVTKVSPTGRVKLIPVEKEWDDDRWNVRAIRSPGTGEFIPLRTYKGDRVKGYRVVKPGAYVKLSDYSYASYVPADEERRWFACTNPAYGR